MNAEKAIYRCGIIPVVVIDDEKKAVPAATALLAGGIDVMEITLRTKAGLPSLAKVVQALPQMCVGAGTVLSVSQCQQAIQAGARFVVSPGFDRDLVQNCLADNIPVFPGCVTPTEIMTALSMGLHILKFFPADLYGGLKGMQALSSPFRDVRFIPTGGIRTENLPEYKAANHVYAVGGSWLCSPKDIGEQNYEKITQMASEAKRVWDKGKPGHTQGVK